MSDTGVPRWSFSIRPPNELQVISGIREVEALVDEGKVGDDRVGQGDRESGPREEGRVYDLDSLQRPIAVDLDSVNDGDPTSLDDARPVAGTLGISVGHRDCQRAITGHVVGKEAQ